MELTPHETAIVELLRAMGSEPLYLAFTSAGEGVAFTLVTPGVAPVAGWGAGVEEAFSNAFSVPEPTPQAMPAPRAPLRVVAGTDGQQRSPRT